MYRFWSDVALLPEAAARLREVGILGGPGFPSEARAQDLASADAALVGSGFAGNGETLKRATRLKALARIGIGYDNIDLDAATALGICATNTPEAPTIATAEFTIGLMLAVTRRITAADRLMHAKGWAPASELVGSDLAGKVLGLVGLGRIGSRVARIAAALDMIVFAYDPFVDPMHARTLRIELLPDLAPLLAAADVVSLHLPLTDSTRHIIDGFRLSQMKKGSVLINASRGPIVDERALAAALSSGHLLGAGLDVWESEPGEANNELLGFDRVVATPHIAAATKEGQRRSNHGAVECVLAILHGERPNSLLNPSVWSSRRT